jgi:isoleucyl-tRNA synthetase
MSAVKPLVDFVDDWSKWYVRRSRDRVGLSAENEEDKKAYYATMYYVFATVCKVAAPITPFLAEEIYTHVTEKDSVHLQDWPTDVTFDQKRLDTMTVVRDLVEAGHRVRKTAQLKVRQPLQSVTLKTPKGVVFPQELLAEYSSLMQDELNVKEVLIEEGAESQADAAYDMTITDDLKNEGDARELVRTVQQERQKMGLKQSDKISLTLPEIPDGFDTYISQKVLAVSLTKGTELKVEKA